jgi:hypothetical protein
MFISRSAVWWLWGSAFSVFIITLLFTLFKINGSPDVVALHYNVIIGVDRLGSKWQLLVLPGVGAFMLVINFVLAWAVRSTGRFVPFLAALASVVGNLLLLLAILFLLRVN